MSVATTKPEVCLDAREERAKEGLEIAKSEIRRAYRFGMVPRSVDSSDLESVANEAILEVLDNGGAAIRVRVWSRLINFLLRFHNASDEDERVVSSVRADLVDIDSVQVDLTSRERAPRIDVYALLSALTIAQQRVISLLYFVGCTEDEAGETLGIDRSSVRAHEKRALKKMRNILSDMSPKYAAFFGSNSEGECNSLRSTSLDDTSSRCRSRTEQDVRF